MLRTGKIILGFPNLTKPNEWILRPTALLAVPSIVKDNNILIININ